LNAHGAGASMVFGRYGNSQTRPPHAMVARNALPLFCMTFRDRRVRTFRNKQKRNAILIFVRKKVLYRGSIERIEKDLKPIAHSQAGTGSCTITQKALVVLYSVEKW